MEEDNIKKTIIKYYRDYLKTEPDPDGLQHQLKHIKSGTLKLEQLAEILQNSEEGKAVSLLNHSCLYTKHGIKMYLDRNDLAICKTLAKEYVWEENEVNFLKKIIVPNMSVIDIGANIGCFTLLFAQWVGSQGKVYSFEPEPSNLKLLMKNLTANRIKNVCCFQDAVFNKNEKKSLFLSTYNMGDHRLIDFFAYEGDDKREKIEVESVRLDSIISDSEKIDFIKVDIQGSEIQALQGMKNILNNNKKISLLIEFWPFAIEKTGHSTREFLEILEQFQFKIFSVGKNKVVEFTKNHKILTEFKVLESLNLFCVK